MILIPFVDLQKVSLFLKFGGYGSKIESATPLGSSKLKWAWRTQFLSYTLQILGKVIFFEDLQMILLSLLEKIIIAKVLKNVPKLSVQVWRSL